VKTTKKVAASAAVTAALLLQTAEPASAAWVTTTKIYNGRTLFGRLAKSHVPGDLFWADDHRNSEAPPLTFPLSSVCNYRGFMAEINPVYGVVFTETSNLQSGCDYAAWINFDGWDSNYLEGTSFRHKWDSDHTGTWIHIGDIGPLY